MRQDEERRGEERRNEMTTERCAFKKEIRGGGREETRCRKNVNREKEGEDEPMAICHSKYTVGQMKWLYDYWTQDNTDSKGRELSI